MPYLIMREKSKATAKPWFSRLLRHAARKRSGSILGQNTHRHIYSLTYFSRTHTHKYQDCADEKRTSLIPELTWK